MTTQTVTTELPVHPGLEAAIEGDPDAPGGYLVYGDWLQTRGHPLGDLIAIQQRLAGAPEGAEADGLRALEASLLHTHGELLIGSLSRGDGILLDWRLGFLRGARIQQGLGYRRRRQSSVDALEWFLALPGARFLTDLTLAGAGRGDYRGEIESLARHRRPKTLRRLTIGVSHLHDNALLGTDFGSILGDVSPLYAAFPRLSELVLETHDVELGRIDLDELRRFELRANPLGEPEVEQLMRARWPRLEALVVWFWPADEHRALLLHRLLAHLEEHVPTLRHLGLFCTAETGALCDRLSTSKLLARLESLDLWMGSLDDGAVTRIARSGAFAHLRSLDLSRNRITPAGFAALAPLAHAVALGGQRA